MQPTAEEWAWSNIWPIKLPYPSRNWPCAMIPPVELRWVLWFQPGWELKLWISESAFFPCTQFAKLDAWKTWNMDKSCWKHFSLKKYPRFQLIPFDDHATFYQLVLAFWLASDSSFWRMGDIELLFILTPAFYCFDWSKVLKYCVIILQCIFKFYCASFSTLCQCMMGSLIFLL